MALSMSSLKLLVVASLCLIGSVKCAEDLVIVSGVRLKANMSYSDIPVGVGYLEDLEAGQSYFGDSVLFYSESYRICQFPADVYFGGLEESSEKWVSRFLQINREEFVYINEYDNCVHKFNRLNRSHVFDIAGYRRRKGFQDGFGRNAMFNYTFDIIIDIRSPGKVIVSDKGNKALRSVDLDSGEVKTIANLSFSPTYMSWTHNNLSLLVSGEKDVYNVTFGEEVIVENLTRGCCGGEEFFGGFTRPKEFVMLTEHVGVFIDPVDIYNRRSVLKVKDFRTTEPAKVYCPKFFRNCQLLWYLNALFYHNGVLYVGALGDIYRIPVEILEEDVGTKPAIQPTTTTIKSSTQNRTTNPRVSQNGDTTTSTTFNDPSVSKQTSPTAENLHQHNVTSFATMTSTEIENTSNHTSLEVNENKTKSSVPNIRLRSAYRMCGTSTEDLPSSTVNTAPTSSRHNCVIFIVVLLSFATLL